MSRPPKIQLPDGYNPYDMNLKLQFNPKADAINIVGIAKKYPGLLCGAKKGDHLCTLAAGHGTNHLGYGRCKFHGGCSTGPRTEEGKARSIKNNIIHGLYAKTLQPEEREVYESLVAGDECTSLEHEINLLRTKIVSYLARKQAEYEKIKAEKGEDAAYVASRVWYREGDSGARSFYHAATIEDKPLDNALNRLRLLVESHKRLQDPDKQDNLVDAINAELRAASRGQVSLSWGGKSQRHGEDTDEMQ